MKILLVSLGVGVLLAVSGCDKGGTGDGRPQELEILKATYGAGKNRTVDVTDEVRSLAKSGSIRLYPQWAMGVDPAYGVVKRMTVAYRYKGKVGVGSFDQLEELAIPTRAEMKAGPKHAEPRE